MHLIVRVIFWINSEHSEIKYLKPELLKLLYVNIIQFSSIQSLSHVQLFATPWIAAGQASLSITISGIHSNSRPSSRWSHSAISFSVVPFASCPLIPPSIRVFSNESILCMRWPKYWSFNFSISPSKEIPVLISFSMDWLDLLVRNANQNHNEVPFTPVRMAAIQKVYKQ